MAEEVRCRDAGYDCDFRIRDENEDELVDLVQQHSERTHEKPVSRKDVEGLMKEA
jgi:predicted small metal-binding protein